MKTNLQKAQDFAIGQCLSDYPSDATYDDSCLMLRCYERNPDTDELLVIVWAPFEYLDVVHIMDNMVSAVTRLLDAQRENQ